MSKRRTLYTGKRVLRLKDREKTEMFTASMKEGSKYVIYKYFVDG